MEQFESDSDDESLRKSMKKKGSQRSGKSSSASSLDKS